MKRCPARPAERWRLLLGEASQASLGAAAAAAAMDRALAWLYGRDGGATVDRPDSLDRHGGSEASQLTVPEWINQIHELFPKETIERLERDAIERYGIDEVVTNLDVLERATPNPALLQAVLRTKHLMNPQVLAMARKLVDKVVRELIDKLAQEVQRAFGPARAATVEPKGAASQFAAKLTIARSLRNYDPADKRLVIDKPRFHVNTRRVIEPWQDPARGRPERQHGAVGDPCGGDGGVPVGPARHQDAPDRLRHRGDRPHRRA